MFRMEKNSGRFDAWVNYFGMRDAIIIIGTVPENSGSVGKPKYILHTALVKVS